MQHFTIRFIGALLAFVVGVGTVAILMFRHVQPIRMIEEQSIKQTRQSYDASFVTNQIQLEEKSEAKAVRLAEEFIVQNGYTNLPPLKDTLSYESVEMAANTDEMLKWRHDTLERKAYGLISSGRMGKDGWTVVFRASHPRTKEDNVLGRAVTMDAKFSNLRVEHKAIYMNGNLVKKL